MATLAGSTIASTYTYLLKMDGTSGVTSSLVKVEDGDATDTSLSVSTVAISVDATDKIYLDAGIKERVKRRHKELIEKYQDITLDEVKEDVEVRDHSDETREVAPLKKADDALIINTTNLTVTEVADRIVKEIEAIKK